MKKLARHAVRSSSFWEPKFPFDFAVAYEDHLTRARALRLYEGLAQRLLGDFDFHCNCWNLKDVLNSNLREAAADAAAEADMVILSFHHGTPLAPSVRCWIESWLSKRTGSKGALVALVGTGEENRDPARSTLQYLQSAARRARMDFFTPARLQPMGAPGVGAGLLIEAHAHAHARWGINE